MRITLYSLFLSLAALGYAQQVTYRIVESGPEKAFTNFIAPEYGLEFNSTDLAMFLGASGRVGIGDKIVLEGILRSNVYNLNGLKNGFRTEAGVFLPLKSKTKIKDVPIILSYNPYAGGGVDYRIEETRSITIPDGEYAINYGARGGVHIAQAGASSLAFNEGNINLKGVYLGGQMTTQTYYKTLINDDVNRYGAGFARAYFDIIVFPSSQLTEPTATDGLKKDGLIGWRFGYQWYVSPHHGEYRFLGRSVVSAEIGKRPLSGMMFSMSWGMALFENLLNK